MNREKIIKFETSIDHLTGEEIGAALTFLNNLSQVLDASYFIGIGKKNRPCGKLEVLCHIGDQDFVAREIFRHTHTLGLRIGEIERLTLERSIEKTEAGTDGIQTKCYILDGVRYMRPEADALVREAEKKGIGLPALRIKNIPFNSE